jgi:hypothetical protein
MKKYLILSGLAIAGLGYAQTAVETIEKRKMESYIEKGTGAFDMQGTIQMDTLNESTTDNGVVVDGATIKDGGMSGSGSISIDTINENTATAGVTIEGVLLKDSNVTSDSSVSNPFLRLATTTNSNATTRMSTKNGATFYTGDFSTSSTGVDIKVATGAAIDTGLTTVLRANFAGDVELIADVAGTCGIGNVCSGEGTPSYSSAAGGYATCTLAAATSKIYWQRVGDVVTMSGYISIGGASSCTGGAASGTIDVAFSAQSPFGSNFASNFDCNGLYSADGGGDSRGIVTAVSGTQTLRMIGYNYTGNSLNANHSWTVTCKVN